MIMINLQFYILCFLMGPSGGARKTSTTPTKVLKQMALVLTDVEDVPDWCLWLAFWGFSQEGLLWSLYMDDPGLMCSDDVTDDGMRVDWDGSFQNYVSKTASGEMMVSQRNVGLYTITIIKTWQVTHACFFFPFGWGHIRNTGQGSLWEHAIGH